MPRNINVICGTVIIVIMANLKANHVPQVLRKNAWLHLWGVLRFPVPERPVFLLHLDEINEHVLRPKIEALM